jgi:hypothetical protein
MSGNGEVNDTNGESNITATREAEGDSVGNTEADDHKKQGSFYQQSDEEAPEDEHDQSQSHSAKSRLFTSRSSQSHLSRSRSSRTASSRYDVRVSSPDSPNVRITLRTPKSTIQSMPETQEGTLLLTQLLGLVLDSSYALEDRRKVARKEFENEGLETPGLETPGSKVTGNENCAGYASPTGVQGGQCCCEFFRRHRLLMRHHRIHRRQMRLLGDSDKGETKGKSISNVEPEVSNPPATST